MIGCNEKNNLPITWNLYKSGNIRQAQIRDIQINCVKVIKVQRKPRVSTEIRTQWQLNEMHDSGLHFFAIKKNRTINKT